MLAHRRGRVPHPVRGSRGETLVELVATIALMGFGMVAIIGSLLVSSSTARSSKERTQASVILNNWAERITAPKQPDGSTNWGDCEAVFFAPSLSQYPGFTISWKSEFMEGTNPARTSPAPNYASPVWLDVDGCTIQGGANVQKVTLYVSTKPGRDQITDSLVVYKRNPTCPGMPYTNPGTGPC